MFEDDNQDNINSTNEHEDQPERPANDPSERGASGSVQAPEGVCPCNTPPSMIHTTTQLIDNTNKSESAYQVLNAGIDSVYISYVINAPNLERYKSLQDLKRQAQEAKSTPPIFQMLRQNSQPFSRRKFQGIHQKDRF